MDRNMGMEAVMGIGGGTVSEESTRNLRIAEDLCRKRRPNEALPYLDKAMKDVRNLDACIQFAFLAPNLEASTDILENARKLGETFLKRDLDPKMFDDDNQYAGRFWSLLETRPYMRTLQALVRIHEENKQFAKAAEVTIEMLRLCPLDNLGQRFSLGSLLIKARRYADALSFVQNWLESSEPPRGGCVFKNASMIYSAALAAYRLYGDCELARQYLFGAASLNSHVLLKVLGKVQQPKNLHTLPRSTNGTEDAHDYLWLAQDDWMDDDVWNWADGQAKVKALVLKNCSRAGCGRRESKVAEFKRCGSCHLVFYCSADCQKADWQAHRPKCKEHAQMKNMMRTMQSAGG